MGGSDTKVGVWVVVTAAGSGSRLGADQPKALVDVEGFTLLSLATQRALRLPNLAGVVITCPAGLEDKFLQAATPPEEVRGEGRAPETSTGEVPGPAVRVVAGGNSRQASVYEGLKAVRQWMAECGLEGSETKNQVVLVHDAARALAPTGLMDRLARSVGGRIAGAIPGLPVTDTIKQVSPSPAGTGLETVTQTVDRASLRAIQTPQGFLFAPLWEAHVNNASLGGDENTAATDDAALLEAAGHTVAVIPGDELAFKVTTKPDLELVAKHLRNQE